MVPVANLQSQSTAKVKTGQLWSKGKEDLKKQLGELKTELGQLRTQKIAGGAAAKLTKMYESPFEFEATSGISDIYLLRQ